MKQALLFLTAGLMAVSCGTTRRTASSTIETHDSVQIAVQDTLERDSIHTVETIIRDTIITTPAAAAAQTITPRQLIPGTSYTTASGHARTTTTVDDEGNLHITCECDSIKTVVRALMERNSYLERNQSRSHVASTDKTSRAAVHTKETTSKTRSWLAGNWWWLAGIVVAIIGVEVVQAIRGKRTNRPLG